MALIARIRSHIDAKLETNASAAMSDHSLFNDSDEFISVAFGKLGFFRHVRLFE